MSEEEGTISREKYANVAALARCFFSLTARTTRDSLSPSSSFFSSTYFYFSLLYYSRMETAGFSLAPTRRQNIEYSCFVILIPPLFFFFFSL